MQNLVLTILLMCIDSTKHALVTHNKQVNMTQTNQVPMTQNLNIKVCAYATQKQVQSLTH